jgi:hypothetical protein
MKLALNLLRDDQGTQPRARIDEETVREYAARMREGDIFPPLDVFFDGRSYFLANGFHRAHAAIEAGWSEFDCIIHQGKLRDAIWFAFGANAKNARQMDNEDKRRIVEKILYDPEWKKTPQGEIAAHVGVSREYVNRLSKEINPSCDRSQDSERTVERGGTTYTQNTANIGKTRAPNPVVNEMPLDDEPEPQAAAPDEPEPSRPEPERAAESAEQPTTPDHAINALRNFIDVILDELDSDSARHYAVNETIKYLREKSIALNRAS